MRAPLLLLLMAAASLAAGPLARRNPWMSACDLDTDPDTWGSARCEIRCSTNATPLDTKAVLQVCHKDKSERIKTMDPMRLVTCCERSPAEALDAHGRSLLKASFEVCNATLHELIKLDSLANDMHCTFVNLLARYDCQQSYSVRHSCSNCQDTYRRWVCSTLIPYFANETEIKNRSASEGARSRRNAPGDHSAEDETGSEVQSEQTQSRDVESETRTVHSKSETIRQEFLQDHGARFSNSDKYFGQRHSDFLKPNTFRKKDDSSLPIGDLSSSVTIHSNAHGIESVTSAEYIYKRTSSVPEDEKEINEESNSIALVTSDFHDKFRKGNSNTQTRRKTRQQWSNQNKRRGNRSSNRESTDPWLGVNKANLSSKIQRSRRKGRHKKDGENENPPELLTFIANSTGEDGRISAELVGPRSGRWRRAAAAGPGRPDPEDSSVWRIKPCISICQEVEQKCPYFLPGDKAPASSNQYAGEPTFICLDPNIPETGEQKEKSNYGLDSCCYTYCRENSSTICVQCEAPSEETVPEAEICYPVLERQSTCSILIQTNSSKRNTFNLCLIIILALCAYFGYSIQDSSFSYLTRKPSALRDKGVVACVQARVLNNKKIKCKRNNNIERTLNKKHLYLIESVNDTWL